MEWSADVSARFNCKLSEFSSWWASEHGEYLTLIYDSDTLKAIRRLLILQHH